MTDILTLRKFEALSPSVGVEPTCAGAESISVQL
jgi:hypothetical protein